MKINFIKDQELDWETVGEGVRRKIMAYDETMMLVKVSFQKGSIGAIHDHIHRQMSYVERGSFEVTIGGEQNILGQGDVFFVQPGVLHGVLCLEAGILVDIFNPMRKDFLA
ncbi:cupin domain-containing protein [Dyadobacter tibetensis]|uniref:cupin domain-containing protein n=1 Tax=Dyadobacter tibetensis TaxID=1211851 RepID=UPI0004702D30|nr:cupin domain-containing protein [Dyadobacter tibetensis]